MMELLLDTHAFLWWAIEPGKLSPDVLTKCQDSTTDLMLSVVSVWEIMIKVQLGKLVLPVPIQNLIATQQQVNRFRLLPVEMKHVLAVEGLPMFHKDPFDRLLIAQAISEGATIASIDHVFAQYPVGVLW